MTDRDEFVSASDLARMGYCERQVAFDASHGQRVTVEQERAGEEESAGGGEQADLAPPTHPAKRPRGRPRKVRPAEA